MINDFNPQDYLISQARLTSKALVLVANLALVASLVMKEVALHYKERSIQALRARIDIQSNLLVQAHDDYKTWNRVMIADSNTIAGLTRQRDEATTECDRAIIVAATEGYAAAYNGVDPVTFVKALQDCFGSNKVSILVRTNDPQDWLGQPNPRRL